jgi:hypothetical protein
MDWRVGHLGLVAALTLIASNVAFAGPPFVTDDPEPTEYRHLEAYLYSEGNIARHQMSGSIVGAEINYGAAPNLQISAALPLGFSAASRAATDYGVTDAEFGAKYRFIAEDDEGRRPQVSFYPSVQVAIGGSGKEMSDSATHIFLPVWAQKSIGPWTMFGGGGYRINPGPEGKNSWFAGLATLRQLSDRLQLGVEAYYETADAADEKATEGMNLGAILDLSDAFHLVGSAGPQNGDGHGMLLSYYFGLEWTT